MSAGLLGWRPARLWLLVAVAVGCAMLSPPARWQAKHLLARHWQHRLATAADPDAPEYVRSIVDLGEPAFGVLVSLLGSERAVVVLAAERALRAELAACATLPAAEAAARRDRLAAELAAQVDGWRSPTRRIASDLAIELLSADRDDNAAADSYFLSNCEHVLRMTASQRRALERERLLRGPSGLALHRASVAPTPRPTASVAVLPGGALGVDSIRVPALPESAQPQLADEGPLRRLPDSSDADFIGGPRRLDTSPAANMPAHRSEEEEELESALQTPEQIRPLSANDPVIEDEDPAKVLKLMHLLHHADASIRDRAASRLAEHGFGPLQLELARQLTDASAVVRRQLAESLPGMPGVDAKVWLIWLSRDEDSDVRLCALTIMATMGDPATMERIEQMSRLDADPRVQRQGERVLEQRRQMSGRLPSRRQ